MVDLKKIVDLKKWTINVAANKKTKEVEAEQQQRKQQQEAEEEKLRIEEEEIKKEQEEFKKQEEEEKERIRIANEQEQAAKKLKETEKKQKQQEKEKEEEKQKKEKAIEKLRLEQEAKNEKKKKNEVAQKKRAEEEAAKLNLKRGKPATITTATKPIVKRTKVSEDVELVSEEEEDDTIETRKIKVIKSPVTVQQPLVMSPRTAVSDTTAAVHVPVNNNTTTTMMQDVQYEVMKSKLDHIITIVQQQTATIMQMQKAQKEVLCKYIDTN
jgi:hypothetical protein